MTKPSTTKPRKPQSKPGTQAKPTRQAKRNPPSAEVTQQQLPALFKSFYPMLRQTNPVPDDYDVIWVGPHYIDANDRWYRTDFTLRRGVLTGSICMPGGDALMKANILTGDIEWVDVDRPLWPRGSDHWPKALPQIHDRLKTALVDLDAYNRQVEQDMPKTCRTGKIVRHLTWAKGTERMPKEQIATAKRAAQSAMGLPRLPAMSTAEYVRIAGIALAGAYPEDNALPTEERHRRHADARHGGMLDLPRDDADAFRRWFMSTAWEGSHPFEIVYGFPHGILLWPELKEDGWRLLLSVRDEFYEDKAILMTIALFQAGIPFEFSQAESVLRALEGLDDVAVGPGSRISLEELRTKRPDAIAHIRWNPLIKLALLTPEQEARIVWVEEHETLAGFNREQA